MPPRHGRIEETRAAAATTSAAELPLGDTSAALV